jgi:NAD(P)-dependent dehydrogenase (short-subunit alcohol dehydrogenase family)
MKGRVAVVTGAAQGIGEAYARGMAAAGARVVLADIDTDALDRAVTAIRSDGLAANAFPVDVSDPEEVDDLATYVTGEYGGLDVLVNNAALEGAPTPVPLEQIDPTAFDRALAVNLKGMWLVARALLPAMRSRGGGSIINQGSIGAFVGYVGTGPYCSSKMGVVGLTRVMAREWGAYKIRVNCLAPGVVATPSVMEHVSPEVVEQIIAGQCLPEMIQPHDLVEPLLFLASDASRFITGQTLIVDGGVVLSP